MKQSNSTEYIKPTVDKNNSQLKKTTVLEYIEIEETTIWTALSLKIAILHWIIL